MARPKEQAERLPTKLNDAYSPEEKLVQAILDAESYIDSARRERFEQESERMAYRAQWPGKIVKVRCVVPNVHFGDGRQAFHGEIAEVPKSLAALLIEKGQCEHV